MRRSPGATVRADARLSVVTCGQYPPSRWGYHATLRAPWRPGNRVSHRPCGQRVDSAACRVDRLGTALGTTARPVPESGSDLGRCDPQSCGGRFFTPLSTRPPDLTSPPFVPSSHRLVHAYPHRRPHPPHLWTTPVDKVPGSGDGGVDSLCPRPAGGQCDGPIHRENSPAPRAMRPEPGSHSHFTSISVECGAPHVFCA